MKKRPGMTRRERMFAAIRRAPVDRVPYATYNLHPYGAGVQGYQTDKTSARRSAHMDDATYAPLLTYVRARAGAFIKTGAAGLGEALSRPQPGRTETTITGEGDARTRTSVLHTPRGDLTCVTRIPVGKPGMTLKPYIVTDADIEAYMSIPYEPPEFDLSNTRAVYEDAGDRAIVSVSYAEPMHAVAALFDFEDFCIRCATELPTVLRFIGWAQERCVENMKRLSAACAGMDVVLHTGGPEICTPPMMAPSLFARLVTPTLKELVEIIHAAGLTAGVHCHGRVRDVFPEILKAGVDLLEPIEPPDQGDIGIAELMERAAGRLCLMGHIQDQELYSAPPGFMTQRVEAIARVVNGRTGYIMSPTCTPFEIPCTPVYQRNYLEWMEAAERLLK